MNSHAKHQPWTDVAVFEDWATAGAVETSLTLHDVPARTYDDKFFRRFLFLRPPRITYRVQVHAENYERANEHLLTAFPDGLRGAIHCPDCGSLQVSYPQMTRKFVLPTIMLHLGILLWLIDHQCYCDHCHAMWSLSEPGHEFEPNAAGHSA